MIRKQRLRTTGRHFERANKGETGERKNEKGSGWGRGKRREEGGGLGVGRTPHPTPSPTPFPSRFSSPQFLRCSRVQNGGRSFVIAVFESFPPQNRLLCRLYLNKPDFHDSWYSFFNMLKHSTLTACRRNFRKICERVFQ